MKRVAVTDLKNRLSEFLRLVKRGETVEILERNVPIARLEAVRPASHATSDHVERLLREGLARGPKRKPDAAFWSFRPVPCSADAVRILLEERGER
jgi:prevent-host-death family protein